MLQNFDQKLDRIIAKMSQMDDEIAVLVTDVTAMRGAVDSATALINGFQTAMAKAVADALAAGATPAQLQSLTDLDTSLNAEKTDLASAVAANTPPAP
jgi:formaldehyde-activating enzyme involved in methanogenesis